MRRRAKPPSSHSRTLHLFLRFIKDKIEQLVVSLEHARHCRSSHSFISFVRSIKEKRIKKKEKETRAFAPASELDSDARVGVLGEVEDRLALGLVERRLRTLGPAVAASVSARGHAATL